MLTAYVPQPTADYVPVPTTNGLTSMVDAEMKALIDENYELKQELDALRMKYKDLAEAHHDLCERENEMENQIAKMTAKYMSAKYALEAAERCIVNMSLKLHGGEEYA